MKHRALLPLLVFFIFCASVLAILISCGGNGGSNTNSGNGAIAMGAITTNISDPGTCAAPTGPYSHVWVTVTDVQGNTNGSAGDNDSGWQDFTPNLSKNPIQVDLLGPATEGCFLAQLGAGTAIPAGNYEQLRIVLAPNNGGNAVANNQCMGNDLNCVVLTADGSVHTLQLSSESQTGIKIPSSQVAGGGLNVPANQTSDLDIDFNACESIVDEAGMFRLKPVLHAGEVSLTQSTAISGTAIDSVTKAAPIGGTIVAALEQKDMNGVDRVIMETLATGSGQFSFCPVPAGTYDVVVSAIDGSKVQFAATITTGVGPGASLGNVPLIAQPSGSTASSTINGTVDTAGSGGGVSTDVAVSALQQVSGVSYTIPLAAQSADLITVTTAAGSCPSGTDCATYSLMVPAANPNIGAFSSGGTKYSQAGGNVNYLVDGQAFMLSNPGASDCTQSDVQVNTLSGGGSITVSAGQSFTAADISFTGCS